MKKYSTSTIVFSVVVIVLAWLILPQALNFKVTWDLFGSYIYLPLVFERHDLVLHDLSYVDAINNVHHVSPTLYQFVGTSDELFYTKYTAGWAILQTPFYLIAECWAHLGNYSTDGFSFPYQFMMHFGAFFYAILGLYFVKKLLAYFFSDKLVAALLLLMIFGTNLFVMYITAITMTHIFTFCFLALLILRVIRFYSNPSVKNAILVGIVWGLLTLIRPPDGIFGLLIFLWGARSFSEIKGKFKWFFVDRRKETIAIAISFIITILPQLIYWYISTGSWLINSYANNSGEGFDLTHPHTYEFLFSFRKGWFIYTPIMILAIFGAWKMRKENKNSFALIATSVLFLYIISSWTTWWYAASFGQRAAVDMYPIMIIFIGFFIKYFWDASLRWILSSLIGLIIILNLFQSYQFSIQIIDSWRMTREYYFSTFGQLTPVTPDQKKLLAIDREVMWREGFKDELNYKKIHDEKENFHPVEVITVEELYAKECFLRCNDFVHKSHVWLRVTWEYTGKKEELKGTVFYVSTQYNKTNYTWVGYELDQNYVRLDTVQKTIQFDYLSPHLRSNSDVFCVGLFKGSGDPIHLKSRQVEIFEPILDYE